MPLSSIEDKGIFDGRLNDGRDHTISSIHAWLIVPHNWGRNTPNMLSEYCVGRNTPHLVHFTLLHRGRNTPSMQRHLFCWALELVLGEKHPKLVLPQQGEEHPQASSVFILRYRTHTWSGNLQLFSVHLWQACTGIMKPCLALFTLHPGLVRCISADGMSQTSSLCFLEYFTRCAFACTLYIWTWHCLMIATGFLFTMDSAFCQSESWISEH